MLNVQKEILWCTFHGINYGQIDLTVGFFREDVSDSLPQQECAFRKIELANVHMYLKRPNQTSKY